MDTEIYKNRFSLKIVGRSGQGINTLGEIIAKALKRTGFSTFAYREYPSLIKGGHATYQIDWSNDQIYSSVEKLDLLVVLNKQDTNWHLSELKKSSIIIHDIPNPRINNIELTKIKELDIKLIYIPALELSKSVGGNEITSNIVSLGVIWSILNLPLENLSQVVAEKFASKPKFLQLDLDCAEAGYNFSQLQLPDYPSRNIKPGEVESEDKSSVHYVDDINAIKKQFLLTPDEKFKDYYLITGNESYALGAVNAGVRIHYAYPMTPSSSILSYLASVAKDYGLIVKQAEGEITAAAMAIGSNHMGTRAMTATSGGGFDLMTEHISLAAITETPFVCVLAQRPGPATGLPTWTSQGDLMLAIFSSHGEFPRCVIASKTPEDCFTDIQNAFNIAEEYQIPVIVLTDKHLAETLYSVSKLDQDLVEIKRGKLITNSDSLLELKSTDRYEITENGISKRWAPGTSKADFNANSDEHDEEGNVVEDAIPAKKMLDKRMEKLSTLKMNLPVPVIHYNHIDDNVNEIGKIRLIGWGSVFGVVNDLGNYYKTKGIKLDYLDIKYLWPFPGEFVNDYISHSRIPLLIENNQTSQLNKIIKMETGQSIPDENIFLKYDGRPFFLEEVVEWIESNNLIDIY